MGNESFFDNPYHRRTLLEKLTRDQEKPAPQRRRRRRKRNDKTRVAPGTFWKRYNAYLASEAWKVLRQRIFRERGRRCEQCGSTRRLQLHHRTYSHVFNERTEQLQILCHDCHKAKHAE